ncbi:MAG: hypothetical protein OEW06_08185 [Gemmatimonadota bacterium]|nr:hypothetical protein [Gemmatimonadota bacterium]
MLTPLVVWAASFVGAWLGALLAGRVGGPAGGIGLMAVGAGVVTVVAVVVWVRLLRRGADRAAHLPGAPSRLPPEEIP